MIAYNIVCGDIDNMSQFASLSHYLPRLLSSLQNIRHTDNRLQATSNAELLHTVSNATTSKQLTRSVNKVQERLWKIRPSHSTEQRQLADQLVDALNTHVIFAPTMSMRTTAASFLRMIVQMGLPSQPEVVFATFVIAIVQASDNTSQSEQERYVYLKLLFECFWPFRPPSPAFTQGQFPSNTIFYPLVPLLDKFSPRAQEMLLCVFAELPSLSEHEFTDYLLPFTLRWSQHSDAHYRQSVCDVLARMRVEQAYETLLRLTCDTEASVRERAGYALLYAR